MECLRLAVLLLTSSGLLVRAAAPPTPSFAMALDLAVAGKDEPMSLQPRAKWSGLSAPLTQPALERGEQTHRNMDAYDRCCSSIWCERK